MLAMELEWSLLARRVILRADGTVDIEGGAVDTLLVIPAKFPKALQLSLAGRISAPIEEWREHGHFLRIEMFGPAGNSVRVIREPLREIDPPDLLRPGALPGRLVALVVRWTAQSTGTYSLELSLDGEDVRRFAIYVVE
jgi:hypothetical protein